MLCMRSQAPACACHAIPPCSCLASFKQVASLIGARPGHADSSIPEAGRWAGCYGHKTLQWTLVTSSQPLQTGCRHAVERLAVQVRDEAPNAYKDLTKVMANQKDLVDVELRLLPLINVKGF